MIKFPLSSWHHILKTHLLQGKRNRRGDHLIYTLIREAVPRYAQKYIHRILGMDGGDLEDQKYVEIMRRASFIHEDEIEVRFLTCKSICMVTELNSIVYCTSQVRRAVAINTRQNI